MVGTILMFVVSTRGRCTCVGHIEYFSDLSVFNGVSDDRLIIKRIMYSKKLGRMVYGLCAETLLLRPTNIKRSSPSESANRVLSTWTVCKHQRYRSLLNKHHDRSVNQSCAVWKIR